MSGKKTTPELPSQLAKPIYVLPHAGVLGDTEESLRARVQEPLAENLWRLFDHFEIDTAHPDCWRSLALQLAHKFIPGMRVEIGYPAKPGRKRTWQPDRDQALISAVAEVRAARGTNIEKSVALLVKTDPNWSRFAPQSLIARHREARRRVRGRKRIVDALLAPPTPSLWQLYETCQAAGRSGTPSSASGMFGIAGLADDIPASDTDVNSKD